MVAKKEVIYRSAGAHVNHKIPIIPISYTVSQTNSFIKKNIKKFEVIDHIYAIDKNKKLVGVLSTWDLYSHSQQTKISKICKKDHLIKVKSADKEEYAAHLSLKHDLSAIPVVNNEGSFLGIITAKRISQILHRKHTEELFHSAGVHKDHAAFDNVLEIPISQSIKHRIIWLFIGLIGGILAAGLINSFESTLKQNLILASFIPLVVYIADAVGTQLEAFAIRDFALFRNLDYHLYFLKQFIIVAIISALLGAITIIISGFLGIEPIIATSIGIAIFFASLSSILTGLVLPFLFRKLNVDPINASGPIGTILQDLLSVFIYFVIASWLLL
ncbi:MAG: magnesium transporter [Candidatus Woesearchaeota archaeon]|nr:MAG: magnesium transporter [Candidatus Woesearchaeota archaeon]